MARSLEQEQARTDALIQFAIESHNKGIAEDKAWRLRSQQQMEQLMRDQRRQHEEWKEEQERLANEGGVLAGALTGLGTGASIGGSISPGWGHLIGGAIGAVGGGIYGAVEGKQGVAEVAPYAGAVTNLAAMYQMANPPRDYEPGGPLQLDPPGDLQWGEPSSSGSFGMGALGYDSDAMRQAGFGRTSWDRDVAMARASAYPAPAGPRLNIDYTGGAAAETPYAASVQGGAVGDVDNAQNQYMSNALAAARANPFNQPGVIDRYNRVTHPGYLDANIAGARGYNINLPQGYTGLPPAYLRAPPKRR